MFCGESCWDGLYWEAFEACCGASPNGWECVGACRERFNPGWFPKKAGAPAAAAATCWRAPYKKNPNSWLIIFNSFN